MHVNIFVNIFVNNFVDLLSTFLSTDKCSNLFRKSYKLISNLYISNVHVITMTFGWHLMTACHMLYESYYDVITIFLISAGIREHSVSRSELSDSETRNCSEGLRTQQGHIRSTQGHFRVILRSKGHFHFPENLSPRSSISVGLIFFLLSRLKSNDDWRSSWSALTVSSITSVS